MIIDSLFLYPVLGGVGAALICGPLGSFMVWQRLSFLSDSLAHTTLLGIAMSLIFSLDLWFGLLVSPLVLSVILSYSLQPQQAHRSADHVLLLLSQGALTLSLLAISWVELPTIDLMGYLFGDILTLGHQDVHIIWVGGCLIALALYFLWNPLLTLTLHEEIAAVEGYPTHLLRTFLLMIMALSLGFALKVMGALLLSTLLIAPALTARSLTRNPETMCLGASLLGVLWVLCGWALSVEYDIPTGPTTSAAALLGFLLSRIWVNIKNRLA